jgi:phospholipid N-methyltransferase
MNDHIKFLRTFIRKPVSTGAIAPSSQWLAELMTEDMKLSQAETVVELGPGMGAFTQAIQKKLRPDALFFAIELNPEFAEHLTREFPNTNIINGSAERFSEYLNQFGRTSADSVLCGIPWAGLPPDLQNRLLGAVVKSLRPGGKFATFAYIHAAWLPRAQRFRQLLRSNFSQVTMTRVVWRNVPPAFVYRCTK